jgi:hypothetical protein
MSKNVVETEGPQMTSQYGAYALHVEKQGYVQVRAYTSPRAQEPTRTHRPRKLIRERASMLRNA